MLFFSNFSLFSRKSFFPQLPTGPHIIWHSLPGYTISLPFYLALFCRHYSDGYGSIPGPDDWFVSRVEVYKRGGSVRYELLFITVKRTPRPPPLPPHCFVFPPSCENHEYDSLKEAYLIVERRVDNKKPNRRRASEDSAETLNDQGVDDDAETLHEQDVQNESVSNSSSDSPSDFLSWDPNALVRWVDGKKTAWDIPRLILSKNVALIGCVRLGHMDFPTPPPLPADNDFRGTLDILDNPLVEPAPGSPRPITILTLISLATYIDLKYPSHSPSGTSCYWYCATLIHILRKYTRVDFTLNTTRGSIVVNPQDTHSAINDKVTAKFKTDSISAFLICTGVPEDSGIAQVAEAWMLADEKRAQQLRDWRRVELLKMKGLEDGKIERTRRADESSKIADAYRKIVDECGKITDEYGKITDECRKIADELEKMAKERQKLVDEYQEKTAEEQEKIMDEQKKIAEKSEKLVEELRKREAEQKQLLERMKDVYKMKEEADERASGNDAAIERAENNSRAAMAASSSS